MQCRATAAFRGMNLVVRGLQKVPKKRPGTRRFSHSSPTCKKRPQGSACRPPMKLTLLPLLALSTALAMSNPAKAELKVGDKAPEVTGVTETGQKVNLADVYSKQTYTLVYFYPKADTPGCTAQGCSLRDGYESLTDKGVAVVGVSHDDVAAQKAFKDKYHLPFTLIADTDDGRRDAANPSNGLLDSVRRRSIAPDPRRHALPRGRAPKARRIGGAGARGFGRRRLPHRARIAANQHGSRSARPALRALCDGPRPPRHADHVRRGGPAGAHRLCQYCESAAGSPRAPPARERDPAVGWG